MASDYNKSVTSRNSVNPANFSFNTGNIIGYPNKISSGSRSSSGGSTTNITLNLDELLTDNLEEGVTSEKIADPKQYNTDDKKGFFESIGDVFASVGATLAVGTTSVLSGVLDIVEGIGDGVVWVASKAVGIVSPDAEEAMKEFIARDLVSEANEWLYEDTEFGRAINDASYMKYDSELAQGIRDVTEDVAVFAAATALTVFTGGAAAPLTIGLGAAYGLGEASESTYATYGTDTSTFQELLILGNGALSALSWYTSGKLGKGFVELGKSMAEAGVKEILAEMCKGIFSKETLKELLKPGNLVGNAIATLMQAGGDIGLIATKLYNGGEVTPEEWALLVGELIIYFGLNTAEDVLSDTIISYGNPKIDVDMNKTPDVDDAKTIETLDEPPIVAPIPDNPKIDENPVVQPAEMSERPNAEEYERLFTSPESIQRQDQAWNQYLETAADNAYHSSRADGYTPKNPENWRIIQQDLKAEESRLVEMLLSEGYSHDDVEAILSYRYDAAVQFEQSLANWNWGAKEATGAFAAMDRAAITCAEGDIMKADSFYEMLSSDPSTRTTVRMTSNGWKDNFDYQTDPAWGKYTEHGREVKYQELMEIIDRGYADEYNSGDAYFKFKDPKSVDTQPGGRFELEGPYEHTGEAEGLNIVYVTNKDIPQGTSTKDTASILGTNWDADDDIYRGRIPVKGRNGVLIGFSSGGEYSANPFWIPSGYTLDKSNPTGMGSIDLTFGQARTLDGIWRKNN